MKSPVEQIAVDLLVDRAVDDLRMCLNGLLFKLFAVHALEDGGNELLMRRFARSRGYETLPSRTQDPDFREALDELDIAATDYCEWAKRENCRPLYRENIVTACSALEACLKEIAVAVALEFKVAVSRQHTQVFVTAEKLSSEIESIEKAWSKIKGKSSGALGRICEFAKKYLYAEHVIFPANYKMPDLVPESRIVRVCDNANALRNALVHNLGYPRREITIGDEKFAANVPAEPTYITLKNITDVFMELVRPYDPMYFGESIPGI